MKNKIMDLINVKTIITLSLTLVFCIMVLSKTPIPELFREIYTVVVIFYFGTQHQKSQHELEKIKEAKENGK